MIMFNSKLELEFCTIITQTILCVMCITIRLLYPMLVICNILCVMNITTQYTILLYLL